LARPTVAHAAFCPQLAIIWERILDGSWQVKEVKLGKVVLQVNQLANLSLTKCR
jgi:hypothetical protein